MYPGLRSKHSSITFYVPGKLSACPAGANAQHRDRLGRVILSHPGARANTRADLAQYHPQMLSLNGQRGVDAPKTNPGALLPTMPEHAA
jgi:hypothetical protein